MKKKKWKGIPKALYRLRAQGIYLSPSTTNGWPPCCNGGTQGGWRRPLPPSPKDPLNSFQVKLNYPPCLFEDVQRAHKFGSSNWPLAHFSTCRGCCICSSPQTEGIHKALEACPWHGVTYNLPKYFSRFHVIFPWFLLFFAKFHDFSRFSLIFPGSPVNVGTLSWNVSLPHMPIAELYTEI